MDAGLVVAHHYADLRPDQPPRHAVVVGVDGDAGVVLNAPGQLARSACRSSRVNRAIGASPVVPCTRLSATSPIHQARCASSAPQNAKRRPAMALCLT